jgi:ABC-2 type transport system permease protein
MTSATMRRVGGLAWANALLLFRNRLTLFYGLVLPLLPMALLLSAERGDVQTGAVVAGVVLMMAWLFSVFYNVLSLVVTRRDELVLKRLRTGETSDLELLTGLALPSIATAVMVSAAVVLVGMALGLPAPANAALYVVTVLAACGLFWAFALWTAAWTRTAEAAQMTSMPVMLLAIVGTMQRTLPDEVGRVVEYTPGAALDTLVRVTWFDLGGDLLRSLLILAGWIVVAVVLARRSLQWEPRT